MLSPSFIFQGRVGASKAALILMKHSHFDRTPQYAIENSSGNFGVGKEWVENTYCTFAYPLRLDSLTLLQRYDALPGSDGLHKSANLFTGFVRANRERYASVAVRFVSVDSKTYTVKVIKSASSRNDS